MPRGKVTAVMGPSGTGKTTLLRLITGQVFPDRGTVLVDGQDVGQLSMDGIYQLRRRMGMLFQNGALLTDLDVFENVAFPLREHTRLPERLVRQLVLMKLEAVGLRGAAELMPAELSGGMAQRVALARALVNDPSLLLLDEPLAKLDSLTRIAMQAELIRLWQEAGFTGLLVTHDVEEALFLAERVIVFSDRPASVKSEVVVDRPYPRHRGDPYLAELRRRILEDLGLAETW